MHTLEDNVHCIVLRRPDLALATTRAKKKPMTTDYHFQKIQRLNATLSFCVLRGALATVNQGFYLLDGNVGFA